MKKFVRHRFEKAVQDVTDNNRNWLLDEFKEILESNKPYQSKCDHLGYSILSIEEKIKLLDAEINELKDYKAKLKSAKDIVLQTGATAFESFGITKLEGGGISSITVTPAVKASKLNINVVKEQALIEQGFYKKVLDMAKVNKAYVDGEYRDLIRANASIQIVEKDTPARLRVNKRRTKETEIDISGIYIDDLKGAA
jgi:hypothetical protein